MIPHTRKSMGDALQDFNRRCTYYKPPNPETVAAHQAIRQAAVEMGSEIIGRCPPGREVSLALTKIEEAMFWGNAAIARNFGSEGGRGGEA